MQLGTGPAIYAACVCVFTYTPSIIYLSKVPDIAWSRHHNTFDPSLAAVVVMETWYWSDYTRDYLANFLIKHPPFVSTF